MSLTLTSGPVRAFAFKREVRRRTITALEQILNSIPAGVKFTAADVLPHLSATGAHLEPESLANLLIEVSRTHTAGLDRSDAKPPIYEFRLEAAPAPALHLPPVHDDEQQRGPVSQSLRRMETMLVALCRSLSIEVPE